MTTNWADKTPGLTILGIFGPVEYLKVAREVAMEACLEFDTLALSDWGLESSVISTLMSWGQFCVALAGFFQSLSSWKLVYFEAVVLL